MNASEYLRENYKPEDKIAIVLVRDPHVIQRVDTVDKFARDSYQGWLHQLNDRGYNVYHSMNALKPNAFGRKREDIAEVRHVWLDLDKGGRPAVDKILNGEYSGLPKPHYLMETSPEKYQVLWRARSFKAEQIEPLLKNLVKETGADPVATDPSRTMRLPGFINQKYPELRPVVTMERVHADTVMSLRPNDFPKRLYYERRPERQRAELAPSRERGERVGPDELIERALREASRTSSRHFGGLWLALQIRDNGYSPTEAERVMQSYRGLVPDRNAQGKRQPYTEREMLSTLRSVYQTPAREPWKRSRERSHA